MSSTKNTVLKLNDVTKDFYLPHHQHESVKDSFTQLFKKKKKGGNVHHALKGVSFEVEKGDFFGVVGRNGAGKSTLLRIMAEIYQPTTGGVWVKGKLVPFIELGVGFNNNLTARQNVYLNGAMLGFSKKEIDERYPAIVEFAELEKFMDQKLKNFSSGMRVRLAFSVAIQADADILLLDEVLAVGDAAFKKKCFAYFDTLKKNKKTIIFVSHSMGAIREYCNKAVLIEDGKIAHQGSADEVADKYMQLFLDDEKKEALRRQHSTLQGKDRWGTHRVYIDTLEVTKNKGKLRVKVVIDSNDKDVGLVKFGATIHNEKGALVAGFNNYNVDDGEPLEFNGMEKKTLTFDLDDIYTSKTYTISATLASRDLTETYDKWNNITTFSAEKEAFYPIVSPGRLSVKSTKK